MTEEKPKLGRPLIKLDWDKIDELLVKGCSGREIAGNIGIDPNTLYEKCLKEKDITFTEYSQQRYEKGESLLRSVQFDKALNGDNMMLIWLGKNRLKQRDKQPDEIDSAITIKVIDARNNSTQEISMPSIPELSVDSNTRGV
jgi:hypothetical protein